MLSGASEAALKQALWVSWGQGRATNPHLELKEPELFFKDHVVELGKRACAGYIEMLAATLKPLLGKAPAKGEKEDRHSALSTFAGVEPLLAEDPRFLRAPASERSACIAQAGLPNLMQTWQCDIET